MSQTMISFTDAALVSRLGADALAGTALALSVFSLVMFFGLGVITAVSPKLADSFRRGNKQALGAWFGQGTWLSLMLGAVGVAILLNTGSILRVLGQSERIADIAQEYNSGAAIGIVFFFLYVNIRSLMSAVGDPKPLAWIMLGAVPMNFLLSSLLIFGFGPFPAMGVFGAGLGSTIIRALIVLSAVLLLLSSKRLEVLQLVYILSAPKRSQITDLLRLGVPIGFRILVGEGSPAVVAFAVAAYGADSVAVHAVGVRLDSLISVVALGISSATTTVAAWYRADGDEHALKQLRSSIALLGAVYVLVLSGILYVSYSFLLKIIFEISDQTMLDLLWKLLPLVLLSFAFGTWGTMYNGFLVGMFDTALPTVVVTISYWGLGIAGGYVISDLLGLGFLGYWVGMIFANLTVAAFNYLRVSHLIVRQTQDRSHSRQQ